MWKTVLFDLDGTITDSAEGITKCVQHALIQMGYDTPDLDALTCFVGPPLKEMFMQYANLTEKDGERAVELYRERYVPTGMFENHLYPKIEKMLELFKKEGITMAVASSKPEIYVRQILEYFKIEDYFKVIVGSEMDGGRVHKKEVIEEALRRLKMEQHKEQVVLVGDTKYDVKGAKEAGIACIGAAYGYGAIEELRASEPVYIAENVSDVAECILSQHKRQTNETDLYKIWRCIYPVLLHFGLPTVLANVIYFGVIFYQSIATGAYDTISIAETINSQNLFMNALNSAVLIPICIWLYKKDEWKRKDLGIRNRIMVADKPGFKRMILVIIFFLLYSVLLNQLVVWSGFNQLFTTYDEFAEIIFAEKNMLISYLAVAFLAPIAEELIYRGLVYRRIRDYLGVKTAIVMSSLIFGLIHGNMVQFLFACLLGIALAMAYERYKVIWVPIAAHMAINLFSCVTEFAKINIIPAGDIFPMFVFILEGIAVAFLGVFVLKKWKSKKKEAVE